MAIIENQLDGSDDDHLVRMLHYAANRRAKLVVWVAHGFTAKHREIVGWLNDADGIDIYCVEVSAWRIGDSVAPMFRRVVPHDWVEPLALAARIENQAYRAYYGPLIARVRDAGMVHVVEPGWESHVSLRWFSTALDDVYYGLAYGFEDGKSQAFLLMNSADAEQPVYQALLELRSEIEGELGVELEWVLEDGEAWVGISTDGSLDGSDDERQVTLEWMLSNLLALRDALTPRLDSMT